MLVTKRVTVYKSSGSLRITLPKQWCEQNYVKEGTKLDVIGLDMLVILSPKMLSEEKINENIKDIKQNIDVMQRNRSVSAL